MAVDPFSGKEFKSAAENAAYIADVLAVAAKLAEKMPEGKIWCEFETVRAGLEDYRIKVGKIDAICKAEAKKLSEGRATGNSEKARTRLKQQKK